MKRWIALLLALCLSVSALAGCQAKELGAGDFPEPVPSKATEVSWPGEKPEDFRSANELLQYAPDEEALKAYYENIDACKQLALTGTDSEALETLGDTIDEQYSDIQQQQSIAYVLYCCDETDEAAKERYLSATVTMTDAFDAMMLMLREVYQSDSPIKDALFNQWTEQDLKMLEAYSSEVAELEQKNEELVVQFQALDEEEMTQGIIPLYRQMIINSNKIAEIYGYDNYFTYAYEMVYGRDYSVEEVEQVREYAKTYLIPVCIEALGSFAEGFQELPQKEQQVVVDIMEGSYRETSIGYIQKYVQSLPAELQEDMSHIWRYERSIFADTNGAREGAFTIKIGDDAICYFGPGYDGVMTLAHEMGHYSSALHLDLNLCPMDLAELHSQGNEWLFIHSMQQEMKPETYQVLRDYKMYSDMATILTSLLVDDFEQRIYTNPDSVNFQLADFERVANQVCQDYGGTDFVNNCLADFQTYWRLVVMESPVYYVSYAMSDVAALNLYTVALEDPEQAYEVYEHLLKDVDLELGFQENLKAAGLSGPFDDTVYEALYALYVE